MKYELYLDSFFIYNFCMDFFVYVTVHKVMNYSTKLRRCVCAALLGATYSVACVLKIFPHYVEFLCTYVFMATLTVYYISQSKSPRLILRGVIVLYMVTFVYAGFANWVYYMSQLTELKEKIAQHIHLENWHIIAIALFALLSSVVWMYYTRIFKISKNVYNTILYVAGAEIKFSGLLDTGNSLYDPISHKPVAVIEQNKIEKLERWKLNTLAIPYNSVGKNKGIMEAFVADWMIIYKGGDKAKGKLIAKPIIAITKSKLCKNESYDMILHPNYFEGRGI